MKGFALTPPALVDLMVAKLFSRRAPVPRDRLLDPGCGTGEFIAGVMRWCEAHERDVPSIVGIEQHSGRAAEARRRFAGVDKVEIRTADFLRPLSDRFDFIIGNPPYVAITGLSSSERSRYRRDYETATGRFDLYTLFLEQALGVLAPQGRLVFITPEKYLYVDAAAATRRLLRTFDVQELYFAPEDSFEGLVTYPIITTIEHSRPTGWMQVRLRDGIERDVRVPSNGDSWLPAVMGGRQRRSGPTLADICTRISCGVATGADSVFVVPRDQVPRELASFARDTVSGRQMAYADVPRPTHKILMPYDNNGRLLEQSELGALLLYLREPERRTKLLARTCVATKPWYAFHETPPMREIRKVKLLCKDIGAQPHFAVDTSRRIVPRHSVYFAVPTTADVADDLCTYLNSAPAQKWLAENCQRAAKGYLRLQSAVLKRLPIPGEFALTTPVRAEADLVRQSA
ncbi:MAG: class I SAM-dependent methyltransferase [Gemmatimonadota bacterium]|nr:class I SAM-dependent methyltransferase [Gemmatimonadota bacterium]